MQMSEALQAVAAAEDEIEFYCEPGDKGVIAEPLPARQALPDWFRKLPPVTRSELSIDNTGLTIKRCMPFLDALATGWILPLAATVKLEISDSGRTVEAGWQFDRTMVSNHGTHQVAGNPYEPRPPLKFHNYWNVRTPAGWSCLFLPPLNRPHPVYEILAGVVDTDVYSGLIHFPFIATAPDGFHTIEKGAPIVQVIPFRRESANLEGRVRAETKTEAELRVKAHRLTNASEGWYRTDVRAQR